MANKAKPTALKELQGNPGKRPLNKREPKPKEGAPRLPDYWVGDQFAEARAEWRFVVRELPKGVLTKADRSMLELYCLLMASIRRLSRRGVPPKPAMVSQVRALAASFGLEPSSRSKIMVPPNPEEQDPFEVRMKKYQRN